MAMFGGPESMGIHKSDLLSDILRFCDLISENIQPATGKKRSENILCVLLIKVKMTSHHKPFYSVR